MWPARAAAAVRQSAGGQLSVPGMQGSGKTLAFGLPILQLLHSEAPAGDAAADAGHAEAGCQSQQTGRTPLRALILEPTRELAMQV